MPACYAHYRFGKEVYKRLPQEIKQQIKEAPELFLIGLHGPDILFYYNPLSQNEVNQTGHAMHKRPAKEFFEAAIPVVRKGYEKEKIAYLYGFICHFALDYACHGYINQKMKQSGLSHAEIEMEFDRVLMCLDGIDPVPHKTTGHIHPSKKMAEIIKQFFPTISVNQMKEAMLSFKKYNDLLVCPQFGKYLLLKAGLFVSGNYEGIQGMIISRKPNKECIDSNKQLKIRYDKAIEKAKFLIDDYAIKMKAGNVNLDEYFNHTFSFE